MAHPSKTSANPNDFILPDLGEGVHEAELIKWRVEVGQQVNEHDILAEMETDKALVEVPSPRTGVIAALHGKPGEILHVGNPLVTYVGDGPAGGPPLRGGSSETAASKAASNGRHEAPEVAEPAAEREDAGTVVGNMSGAAAGVSAAPGKALATPAVRRLARDMGVDIDTIRGTGIGGRVLEKDVQAARSTATPGGAGRPPRPTSSRNHDDVAPMGPEHPHSAVVEPRSSSSHAEGPSLRGGGGMPAARPAPSRTSPAPEPKLAPRAGSRSDEETRIPFRGVRRTIANRLKESIAQTVHFTVMDEADATQLDTLRRKLAAASGEKVSFLPFVASAVCRVLQDPRFRVLNSTTDDKAEEIIQHRSVHLGIATDTDSGLMVPVIRDTDRLGVLEISRGITMIADMARTRSIPREQLMGSTFTISNVGSHAGRFATPILNYPECGILAVGRAREGMVVNKGSFRVGMLLPLSLACDHRVVDGATAALALAEIIRLLQDPEGLLGPARG
jgi:pyruvate dehydrogenase E2 component (dihydrolipoamide acetyltransferase)